MLHSLTSHIDLHHGTLSTLLMTPSFCWLPGTMRPTLGRPQIRLPTNPMSTSWLQIIRSIIVGGHADTNPFEWDFSTSVVVPHIIEQQLPTLGGTTTSMQWPSSRRGSKLTRRQPPRTTSLRPVSPCPILIDQRQQRVELREAGSRSIYSKQDVSQLSQCLHFSAFIFWSAVHRSTCQTKFLSRSSTSNICCHHPYHSQTSNNASRKFALGYNITVCHWTLQNLAPFSSRLDNPAAAAVQSTKSTSLVRSPRHRNQSTVSGNSITSYPGFTARWCLTNSCLQYCHISVWLLQLTVLRSLY